MGFIRYFCYFYYPGMKPGKAKEITKLKIIHFSLLLFNKSLGLK